jgi:uncharacterized protein
MRALSRHEMHSGYEFACGFGFCSDHCGTEITRTTIMLELRPGCECCDRDLPPSSPDARICTYECTFCIDCAETVLRGICPNCGGNLVTRPIRPAARLLKHPASAIRVFKAEGCVAAG